MARRLDLSMLTAVEAEPLENLAVNDFNMTFYESAKAAANVSTPTMDKILARSRYPKRQRAEEVNYNEEEYKWGASEESDFNYSEDEEEVLPPPSKRVKTARSTKPLKPNKIFPFMKLPPELRNKIYYECLCSNQYDQEGRAALYFDSTTRNFRNTVKLVQRSGVGDPNHPNRLYRRPYMGVCVRPDEQNERREDEPLKDLIPKLLSISKEIYAEAAPIMYNQRFVFSDCLTLHNFMSQITHRTAALIKHIEVRSWAQRRSRGAFRGIIATSIMAAKGCINLESLDITSTLGYFWSYGYRNGPSVPIPRRIARKVYRDFAPWFDAVGFKAGDMYKGVEILDIGDWTFRDTERYGSRNAADGDEETQLETMKNDFRKELKKLIAKNVNW